MGAHRLTHAPPRRRWRRLAVIAGILALALVAATGWAVATRVGPAFNTISYPPGGMTIATGGSGGVYFAYGSAYKQVLGQEMPGLKVRLATTAGSVDNLGRMARGEVQMAFISADTAFKIGEFAQDGAGRQEKTADIRALARVYDEYVQIVVRADSPIRTMADLRGKRVSTGSRGSSVEVTASRLLAAADIDPVRHLRRHQLGIDESVALLRSGGLDAFFWVGGLPTRAIATLSSDLRVRLLPLGSYVNRLRGTFGTFYRRATVPASAYPGVAETETVAVPSYLLVSGSLGPDLVYELTRVLFDGRPRIAATVPSARLLDTRSAIATGPVPLHPGALRYYRAMKP